MRLSDGSLSWRLIRVTTAGGMLLSGSDVLAAGVADATERLNYRITGLTTVTSGRVDSDARIAAKNVTRMEAHSITPASVL